MPVSSTTGIFCNSTLQMLQGSILLDKKQVPKCCERQALMILSVDSASATPYLLCTNRSCCGRHVVQTHTIQGRELLPIINPILHGIHTLTFPCRVRQISPNLILNLVTNLRRTYSIAQEPSQGTHSTLESCTFLSTVGSHNIIHVIIIHRVALFKRLRYTTTRRS